MDSYITLLILLAFSFFFSGTETAVTASSNALLYEKEKQGDKRAKILNVLKKNPSLMIGTLLLGNNVVNIAITALSTALCIEAFGESMGVLIATFGVSIVVLIFSEMLPKTYAMSTPNSFALNVTPALVFFIKVSAPFVIALNSVSKMTMKALKIKLVAHVTEAEIKAEMRGAIALPQGDMMNQERYMMKSVLDLSEVTVEDIMVHRSQMVSLNAALSTDEIVNFVSRSPYSRIPLWAGKRDNIIGILYAKALLKMMNTYYATGMKKVNIQSYLTKPWFVLNTTSLLDQLHEFKRRHEHFAIVVDEYGTLQGVVTLEDVLEEIVGDISDESDVPEQSSLQVTKTESGAYRVDGNATLRDINRHFKWELPDGSASTLAGYIMYKIERIPSVGQTFVIDGFTFTIVGKERNHITQIDIIPPAI